MTYTDKDLEIIPSGTDVTGTALTYYPTAYVDLGVSPDIGTGADLVCLLTIETYTAGSNTALRAYIISASATNLTSNQNIIGDSGAISAADLEAMDDAGRVGYQPIVVRINPNHWDSLSTSTTGVSSDVGRYLSLRLNHAGAAPTTITAHATFVTNWTSNPALSWHKPGSVIA